MKKLLLLIVLTLLLLTEVKAQTSNIILDSCYSAQGYESITGDEPDIVWQWINPADSVWYATEYNLMPGWNLVFRVPTLVYNNGPDACLFGYIDSVEYIYDPEHDHVHKDDFIPLNLLSLTGDTLAKGLKIGYYMVDRSKIALDNCQSDWIIQHGGFDSDVPAEGNPNPPQNMGDPVIMTDGYGDAYDKYTIGNQIVLNRPGMNMTFPQYCKAEIGPLAIPSTVNQGANTDGDKVTLHLYIDADTNVHVIGAFPSLCNDLSVTAPASVILKGKKLSWQPSADADSYNIYRQVAYMVKGELIPNANYPAQFITSTTSTTLHVPQPPSGFKWVYMVSSVNCYGESSMTAAQ